MKAIAVARQHRADPRGILANFGKLRMASVCDGLEFKPHLGGHGDKAHYNRGVLYGAKALTSNRMLPHCDYEGLSTLGLKR